MSGPDQLRQRVAWALSQIFVVSGVKTGQPRQMVPYQNMLLQDAFGNFSKLLYDVTVSPTMGVFLDMVNNDKEDPKKGVVPNENYAREVMQLFTIGTAVLNPDGSVVRDAFGDPIPTYGQNDIVGLTRALTGWTFGGRVIATGHDTGHNKENYEGPMVPVDANHDTGDKSFLGKFLAPGLSAQQDLDASLDTLAAHPNTAPFISLRLIQRMVSSNPSPGYVQRVAGVFAATGGDLWAVTRAILLDPEARYSDDPSAPPNPTEGHLREPVLFVMSMLRNLSATVSNSNPIEGLAADMGQKPFYAPSVFNYFSPLYRLNTGLLAPEFQILNSTTALVRANVVQSLVVRRLDGDARLNFQPFTDLAHSPADLVNAVDNAFLYGRTPAALKDEIVKAISVTTNRSERVRNAIYLVATSSLYQVQH
jgi:uncharacterized protein (DUF1800 family)